ncbi:MAG: hypothetical protein ACR2Q4_04350 [Geminicoccaceae bacterium]
MQCKNRETVNLFLVMDLWDFINWKKNTDEEAMKINMMLYRGDRIRRRGWPSFHDAELRRPPIGRARLWCVAPIDVALDDPQEGSPWSTLDIEGSVDEG